MYCLKLSSLLVLSVILSLVVLSSQKSYSQTWSGLGGDDNWSTSANWVGGVSPQSDQTAVVTFDNPANRSSSNQNITDPLTLNRLSIDTSNGAFQFDGSTIRLSGGSSPNIYMSGGQSATINNDILLALQTDFGTINDATGSLIHNGNVMGDQILRSSGNLIFNGNYTNSGALEAVDNNMQTTFNGTMGAGDSVVVSGILGGTGTINRDVTFEQRFNNVSSTIRSTDTLTINGEMIVAVSGGNGGNTNFAKIDSGTVELNGDVNFTTGKLLYITGNMTGTGTTKIGNGHGVVVHGVTGANRKYNLDLQGSLEASLSGSGTILGETTIDGGMISGSLTFENKIDIIAGAFGAKIGTTSTGGVPASRSSLTFNNAVDIAKLTYASGDFQGNGSINVNSGIELQMQDIDIGTDLTLNVSGTVNSLWSSTAGDEPVIDATVNLQNGTFFAQDTVFNGAINTFGNSTISSNGNGNTFNGQTTVETGTLSLQSVTIDGTGTFTIEDGANVTYNGSASVNQAQILRGTMTDGVATNTVTLEGGDVLGLTTFSENMVVRTGQVSTVGAGANLSVTELTEIQEGTLRIDQTANFNGLGIIQVNAAAALDVQGSIQKDIIVQSNGILQGIGEIEGMIMIDGILDPGNSAGTLEIDGDVVLTDTSMTMVEIGGTMAGTEHDQILGGGVDPSTIALDGILEISLIDDFRPDAMDEFLLFDNFTFTGMFSNTIDGRIFFGGQSFAIDYGTTGGASNSAFRGPNQIMISDFQVTVPEPGVGLFVLMLGAVVVGRRKRIG